MRWQVAGLGNALMDALVVLEDDRVLDQLGLTRGTMHLVNHAEWQRVYEAVRHLKVTFDSGGSCANTVATVGWLGGRARYCGQVGNDQMGLMYADRMERACGGHCLRFTEAQATGKCLAVISTDAERTMLTDLGAAVNLPHIGEFSEVLQDTHVAHFTGYTLLEGPMRSIAINAMAFAKQHGARISLDAADPFVVLQTRDLLWSLLHEYVDIVFLNADEASKLTETSPEEAIHIIHARAGVETVVVKLGGRGSLVMHRGELFQIPVYKVQAVDTTGAGDSYAGGFLWGTVNGWEPERAGHLASKVASMAVAQVGAVVKDREALAAVVESLREVDLGALR